jgi:hypothetical protein
MAVSFFNNLEEVVVKNLSVGSGAKVLEKTGGL